MTVTLQPKEYAGGAVQTTLAFSIGTGDTSAQVVSGASLPTGATYPFVLTLDKGTSSEEKILVTSRSTNNLSGITRAYDGTTAKSHGGSFSSGTVSHGLDALTLTHLWQHIVDATRDDHTQYVSTSGDSITGALASSGGSLTGNWAGAPVFTGGPVFSTVGAVFNSAPTFNGGVALGTSTVTGAANFTGALLLNGGITISNGAALSGTFTGTPTFSGAVIFSGTPVFQTGASLAGTFSGTPTFSGAVVFSGNPSFTGSPTFSTGTPAFNNGANLGTGTFSGAATFSGNVTFSGGPSVTGSISGYNAEIRMGSTGAGQSAGFTTQSTGSPEIDFDHRGTTNTGVWNFRNGTGGATVVVKILADGRVDFHNVPNTTTAPGAGGAGALPATPAGYMTIQVGGADKKVPFY